jgi:bacterioferritin-associated ferredoxin
MIICNCFAVSDSKVKKILSEGSTSVLEVQKKCGAGKDCGTCLLQIQEMLQTRSTKKRK